MKTSIVRLISSQSLQFCRLTSIYFLIVVILSFIPVVSPISPWTTAAGFIFIIGVAAIRELYEDILRARADNKVNKKRFLLWHTPHTRTTPRTHASISHAHTLSFSFSQFVCRHVLCAPVRVGYVCVWVCATFNEWEWECVYECKRVKVCDWEGVGECGSVCELVCVCVSEWVRVSVNE